MRGITTVEGATAGPAAPRRAAGALAAPLATAVAVVTVVVVIRVPVVVVRVADHRRRS